MRVPENEDELIPPEDVLETAKEKIGRYRRMYGDDDEFQVYMNGYDVSGIADLHGHAPTSGPYHILGAKVKETRELMQGQVIVMHERESREHYLGR